MHIERICCGYVVFHLLLACTLQRIGALFLLPCCEPNDVVFHLLLACTLQRIGALVLVPCCEPSVGKHQ